MTAQARIIIAGSRNCPEKSDELFIKVNNIIHNLSYIEIVSGTAKGADRFGEWFANCLEIPIKRFPADWDTHGKSAGYIRNKQMAEYATHLIAIWDGKSKGTKHMIDLAKEYNIKTRIINF